MYEFDEDTVVKKTAEGRWRGELTDRWNIGEIPNGGYVMAVAVKVLSAELPGLDILTVSAHFARPAMPGPVELISQVIHRGKNISTATVRMVQDGGERSCFAATAGKLSTGGPDACTADPPAPPPLEECSPRIVIPGVTPRIHERIDSRMSPRVAGWLQGKLTESMEMGGYTRFADGRQPDAHSLALFCDSFPPTAFTRFGLTGWIPTLQLNLQIRREPSPGWLWCWIKTRHMTSGLFEEDGEIWDSEGRLVAISRQLARYQPEE